jgi:hypothetical protein
MRTMILAVVTSFVIASPVHAAPITWFFFGTTTGSSSEFNGVPIEKGLDFEFRILLDTNIVGIIGDRSLPEIQFKGGEGEVEIAGQVLPVKVPIDFVEYFARCVDFLHCDETKPDFAGREVTGVEFVSQVGKQGLLFSSPIAFLRTPFELSHLGPIGRSNPTPGGPGFDENFEIEGPNGLHVFGKVTQFAAAASAAAIPEGGSTLLFLASALVALGFLQRRYKG